VIAALYIALGVLVAVLVALQVWIARSSAPLAGDRGGLVFAVRILNAALLVLALGLAAYTLLGR
jgi:hypothetical protein